MSTKFPKKVEIDEVSGYVAFDGEQFPYYLAPEGPTLAEPDRTGAPVGILYLPVLVEMDECEIDWRRKGA